MPKNTSVQKDCLHCGNNFKVIFTRRETAKFCSRSCSDLFPRKKNSVRCRECGTEFFKKDSEAKKAIWGNFCGDTCASIVRSRMTMGSGNPNFKGRNFDHDGYRLFSPQASLGLGLGRVKMHHAVAFGCAGIKKMPKLMHVHHKDCDAQNNTPSNLQFMTISDHKWIHKQFGSATLRAIEHGQIDISVAAGWSDDPIRATALLFQNVETQGKIMRYFDSKFGHSDLAIISTLKPVIVNFIEVNELTETERGTGGFGSTGA